MAREIKQVGSWAKERLQRETLLKATRRREVDAVIVYRFIVPESFLDGTRSQQSA